MHVRFSEAAEADLNAIHDYISQYNQAAALRIIDALLLASFQLEAFPFLGRPGKIRDTRELTVPRTPYFIVYTLPDDYTIDVERILHARLQYPALD
jgi:addiction module RelE/StbE family toxin